MRKFRFELLDRYGNLRESAVPLESGTISHESKIKHGGIINLKTDRLKVYEPVPVGEIRKFIANIEKVIKYL